MIYPDPIRPGDRIAIEAAYRSDGRDYFIPLEAFATTTPGVVVHPRLANGLPAGPEWTVCHARSGLALAIVADPEVAQMLAAQLAEFGDWTRSGEQIRSTAPRGLRELLASFERTDVSASPEALAR